MKTVSVAITERIYVDSIGMCYNPIGAKKEFSKNISNSHMKIGSDHQRG